MLISMTGFGRAVSDAPFGRLSIEIQAVNRKYLEVSVSTPKELSRFEHEIRKWVSEKISRGQVSVRVFLIPNTESIQDQLPDIKILKELKSKWEQLSKGLKTDPKEVTLPFIMQYLPTYPKPDLVDDKEVSILKKCVDAALEGLLKMKKVEGAALAKDLKGRLKALLVYIQKIEKYAPDATKKMRKKLQEKMEELFKMDDSFEERLLKEIAIFAERVDIAEELTRFHSHLTQFSGLLNPKGAVVGRKMDFLIQEMGREVNTIGSKSMESKISHLIVDMKSELEKMREQIQNIE